MFGQLTDIIYLTDSWRWLGKHSSYFRLPQYVGRLGSSIRVSETTPRLVNRIAWQLSATPQWPWRNWGYSPGSERTFLKRVNSRPGCVGHILSFEFHHRILARWTTAPETIVATIHHPPAQESVWAPSLYDDLRRLHSAIVLYQRDLDFFERYVEARKVTFIHHGVDTEFFAPGGMEDPRPRRLLYVGINARDIRMLEEVVQRLGVLEPDVRFDFVVPKGSYALRSLWRHPKITWHRNISDERLRSLYQMSYLLLLPLKTSGANNAVIEALACGLPPVTTDVGGIRDYGGESIYPVVAPNDDRAMVRLIQNYLRDSNWRNRVGRDCRAFAEGHLAWPLVARMHLDFYQSLPGL